jgi:hypothetical protein
MSVDLSVYRSMIFAPVMPRRDDRRIVLWIVQRSETGEDHGVLSEFFILESIDGDGN